MTTILFDGRNHPPAATLVADGLGGGLLYTGTPASGKDFTAAQYADYKAHKLITIMGYENGTTDINGGYSLGVQHAFEFLADAKAKRVSPTEPALSAVDEHVSAANLPLAMDYHRGFRDGLKGAGWTGPIGIYGFSETLEAAHAAALADFYFGAGSRSTLPPYTNIWQDNTGTIQVDGANDDRDVVLIPLPTGDTPVATTLSADDLAAIAHAVGAYKNTAVTGDPDMHQHAVDATAALAQSKANATALSNLTTAVAALTKQVATQQDAAPAGSYPVTGTLNIGPEAQPAELVHLESTQFESFEDVIRRLAADGTIKLGGQS